MRIAYSVLGVAMLLASGCGSPRRKITVDPEVTFAAHQERNLVVVDRASDGGGDEIAPVGGFRGPGSAAFTLKAGGQTTAWFWVTAPATVDARPTADAATAPIGQVAPAWQDGAVRLTLRAPDGQTLQSDAFQRVGTGGYSMLSRDVRSTLDLRGTFRADLHDQGGKAAGWLRVQIGPYGDAPRIFDAVLPPAVPPALAAAVTVALGSELDWIEGHTLDVYRGGQSGPLQQSFPINGH